MKNIKKILGSRIYLEAPKKEETKVYVDHNTKEALQKEFLQTLNKLKVLAIGEAAVDSGIAVGDYVLVDPAILARTPMVPITENVSVLSINFYDIMHVWQ